MSTAVDTLRTTKEVAEQLRVSRQTVIKLAESGDLPSIRVGNQFRFRESAIRQYLDRK